MNCLHDACALHLQDAELCESIAGAGSTPERDKECILEWCAHYEVQMHASCAALSMAGWNEGLESCCIGSIVLHGSGLVMADTLLPKLSLLSQSKVACLCCKTIRSSLRLSTGMSKVCRELQRL